jgi:hypothetical protein
MLLARQEIVAELRERDLPSDAREQIIAWLERSEGEALAAAVALIAAVLRAKPSLQWTTLRFIDDNLIAPGLDDRARALIVRRMIERRDTSDEAVGRAAALRAAWGSVDYEQLVAAAAEMRGPSLANAHTLFLHAWRAAPPSACRAPTIHRGEPEPSIGARGNVRIALFTAAAVAHLAKGDERAVFDELVGAVERALVAREHVRSDASAIAERRRGILTIANAPVTEMSLSLARPDSCGAAARPAVAKAVKLIAEREGQAEAGAFLDRLDDELRRVDVIHALEQRKREPTAPITRAIHRGANSDGEVVLWCAELADGRFGLFRKEGRRWLWSEGPRDEIVALVPDGHFDAVAAATKTAA